MLQGDKLVFVITVFICVRGLSLYELSGGEWC